MNIYLVLIVILVLLLTYSFFVCSHLNHQNIELRTKLRYIKVTIDFFGNSNSVKTINEINKIIEKKE